MADIVDYIDAMAGPGVPQPSRWDRGDGRTPIRALDEALANAGLPDRLRAPLRLLDRAEELAGEARAAKEAAVERLEQANRALLAAGPVDTAAYGRVLVEVGPWLDDQAAGTVGVMLACQRVQANSVQVTFGLAPDLYRQLQQVCAEVVAEVAAVPALPREVWVATTTGEASTLAIRAGKELAWTQLVRLFDRWEAAHVAAALLRETGVFQRQLDYPKGCPTRLGTHYLGWEAAEEQVPVIRRLPQPLWVRAAHDRGLRPGLWLREDHERAAAEPRRGLLARLVG